MSNTAKQVRSGIKIAEVEEFLNYRQPYNKLKPMPDICDNSKKCANAIIDEFKGFEGMLYITNTYFHKGDYEKKIPIIFDRLSEYIYPLVNDLVEMRLQSNWLMFYHTLVSEAFLKSKNTYSETCKSEIYSYFYSDLSIDGLRELMRASNFGATGINFNNSSMATAIKAELIYALHYAMSGNLEV